MSLENFGMFFFNIGFSIANGFIGLFVYPIVSALNSLLSIFYPDYETTIVGILSGFTTIIDDVIAPSAVWVVNLVPPFTFNVCLMFLGLWLLVWEYELSVGIIIRILRFIKTTIPFL